MTALLKSARLPVLIAALLAAAGPAAASSAESGMASSISTSAAGLVWFLHSGARVGTPPACDAPNSVWIFDASTVAGQAMLANLLSATASGKPVSIVGTGTCISGHESVAYITTN